MTPKKVWAVIIIVIGIYMIYIGATKCYEADFYGNEIKHMDKQLAQFGGSQFFDSKRYQNLLENEKNNGVIGLLLGVAVAIGGTLLLREKKKKYTPESYAFDTNTNKIDRSFELKETQPEPTAKDNSKWMPPEMTIDKEQNTSPTPPRAKATEIIDLKTGKKESEKEDDETRWMHPDMRKQILSGKD
ncbi:MAG: hypothetical protein H8D87_01050 [Deltaproteobacteria bacterium]|nr:hypothetical protein [Candidatus Desulfobacula maris]